MSFWTSRLLEESITESNLFVKSLKVDFFFDGCRTFCNVSINLANQSSHYLCQMKQIFTHFAEHVNDHLLFFFRVSVNQYKTDLNLELPTKTNDRFGEC